MKIGYFSSKYPYSYSDPDYICGGSVFATQSLVNEISKLGNDIKVFTSSNDSKNHFESESNIEIYRYATNLKLMSSNISFGLFHKPLKHDVDVVHVSFDIPPGPFAGLRYAKKKKVPLIVTYHGDWETNYGNFLRKIGVSISNKLLVDNLLSQADVIISPSKIYLETSDYLNKYEDKIEVIPNGVYLEEFETNVSKIEFKNIINLPQESKVILFFGYLSPYKSPEVLLKALPLILDRIPLAFLVFAGSGVMMKNLIDLSVELGVEENVKFVGFVEKNKRYIYYNAADVFCLPSSMKTESFGIVNLEAMASGLPIVASNFGGIPDVVKDGENGLLIPPNDYISIANAILDLLTNEEKRKKMGINGKNRAKNYSWAKIAKKTNELYNKVI